MRAKKQLWIIMSNGSVNFVKKSQVLMCQFEDCWDRIKSKIIQNHEIIANIKKECWALCDMPQTVCTHRLKTVFSGNKNEYQRRINQTDSILPPEFFKQIVEKSAYIIMPANKKY
jgi:hypothetical protein